MTFVVRFTVLVCTSMDQIIFLKCCFHIKYAVQILWKVHGPTFRMRTTFPLPRTRLRALSIYLRRWFWLYRSSRVLKVWWCIDLSSMPERLHASLMFYYGHKYTDHTINSSFHRSMQSAAFLPMFLMFIALSSRMRVLCLELQSILQQAVSNVVGLLPMIMVRCDGQL